MFILGLAGEAGVGKDTVADYLVEKYGYVKFAFSDMLYAEVQLAFGLEGQDLLRDRSTKEISTPRLALKNCADGEFASLAGQLVLAAAPNIQGPVSEEGLSPRQILQWWGTEYRRAQNPNYWLEQNDVFLEKVLKLYAYPEQRPQYFVNTTCRFPNEQAWIHAKGGNVWHIRRKGVGAINEHISDQRLPVLEGERELFNNDTVERLFLGVDLLMATGAKFVRVEPMADPTGDTSDQTQDQ